ncbi:MAG: hypothetical protein IOB85_15210 [Methylobacterium sp.]|nr:hypothetical protein [Methylobacterium sp.]MCA3665856.1 hypothetical protein [Methylobacterium sp.]MCA3668144.1 hypothetical protein [Methylobacterium sp.]MCA3674760.1 hypothetical protein [Methylobacterium sp.]MCA3678132.1 hypothetical protein [Methylobacterium sp.]
MSDENTNPQNGNADQHGSATAGTGAAGGTGGTQQGSDAPWFSRADYGLDADMQSYFATKTYSSPAEALKAFRTFETLARDRNAMVAPSDPGKLSDWDGWNRLGWEADPAKYTAGVPVFDKFKGDPDYEPFHADMVKAAHELKMPLPQAKALTETIGRLFQARNEALDAATARESEALDRQLRTQWGKDYDANVELGRRAATAFGLDGPDMGELEAIMGTPKFVQAFYKLGKAMGEDTLVTVSTPAGGNVRSPEAARAERQRLKADKDFLASLDDARHPNHRANKERWSRLIEIEAGG